MEELNPTANLYQKAVHRILNFIAFIVDGCSHPLHPGTQTLHVERVIRSGQRKHAQDHPAGSSLSSVFQFNPSRPQNPGMRPQSHEARNGVTRKGSSPRTFQPTCQILPFEGHGVGNHTRKDHRIVMTRIVESPCQILPVFQFTH